MRQVELRYAALSLQRKEIGAGFGAKHEFALCRPVLLERSVNRRPPDLLPSRRYRTSGSVAWALSIGDLRARALKRLPAIAAEHLEGGAEDEISLAANRAAFERLHFHPRFDAAETSAKGSGALDHLPFPLVIAPTGLNGLLWPDGDLALARAAAQVGVPFTQSTVSNASIEDIARVAGLEHWFQLYLFSAMDCVESLIGRAAAAGVHTLVVTTDANTYGNREWNARLYCAESKPTFAAKLDALLHPRWMAQVFLRGLPVFPNIADWLDGEPQDPFSASRWIRLNMAPRVTWGQLERIRALWQGRMLIKGIGHLADARRAMEIGVDGVVLGNHGGRQLDGAVAGIELLPAVRQALGPQAVVLVEGGLRRGADMLKARALGADAVMGGRAPLYGLAAAGEAGAARALSVLGEEYHRAEALLGGGDVILRK